MPRLPGRAASLHACKWGSPADAPGRLPCSILARSWAQVCSALRPVVGLGTGAPEGAGAGPAGREEELGDGRPLGPGVGEAPPPFPAGALGKLGGRGEGGAGGGEEGDEYRGAEGGGAELPGLVSVVEGMLGGGGGGVGAGGKGEGGMDGGEGGCGGGGLGGAGGGRGGGMVMPGGKGGGGKGGRASMRWPNRHLSREEVLERQALSHWRPYQAVEEKKVTGRQGDPGGTALQSLVVQYRSGLAASYSGSLCAYTSAAAASNSTTTDEGGADCPLASCPGNGAW